MYKIKSHLKKHHKKYFFGIFGGRAIFKTVILIAGLFGVVNYELGINKTYAANDFIVWDGGGITNNWSEAENRTDNISPGLTDVAIFNSTSTKDAVINTTLNIKGIDIQTGYIGTITQDTGTSITLGASGYQQIDGTFLGGSGNMNLNYGPLIINGGIFRAPSGILYIYATQLIFNGGIFDANSGTVRYNSHWLNRTLLLNSSLNLYNLTIDSFTNEKLFNIQNNGYDLTVNGDLILANGGFWNGTIISKDNTIIVQSGFLGGYGGNSTIKPMGNVTITTPSGVGNFVNLLVDSGANVTATTGKLVFYGTYFIYSGGTFNPNGGTLEFNPVRQSANGITLRAPLAVENLIINPATNDKTFNIQNNGFEIAISGDLTFMDGFFGNGILTPQNAVIMKPAFDGGQGKIKINNNNIVSVETGAITPVFISGTSPTFNIYSGSHTYFGSDMNISALNLFGVTTLHTNSSPTIRTLSVSTYNHPIEPTLDYVIINPIAPTCPVPNSYIVGLENQSDWNCLGLKDPRYSTGWRSRNLGVDIPYDAVFYFVNTIGRPTNNNKFDTPWHFKFPVSDGILSGNTGKIEMKVKFFTQPE